MVVMLTAIILTVFWLILEAAAQSAIQALVTSFVDDNKTDFPFFFVFSQLSSEILLYIILLVVIYNRHRSNWNAIESLPLVKIVPE